jgi:mannose-6-phosphate isomerase-like protein (cupin superfamily)
VSEIEQTSFPIVELAKANDEFRKVILTGENTQVVLMAIPEGEEIGAETHEGHDQVLIFVAGRGTARIGDSEVEVGPGDLSFVASGTYHNFINTGKGALKLYTMYSPPEHEAGTEHETKAEAEAAEA